HESVCLNDTDLVCQCFYPRWAEVVMGNVHPRRRHGVIGRLTLYGYCVSNIESLSSVNQDNLENQSVHVCWNGRHYFWVDDNCPINGSVACMKGMMLFADLCRGRLESARVSKGFGHGCPHLG